MRSILKKLHIGPGQSDDADGPPSASPSSRGDQKPLSSFSGWLSSIASRSSSPSPPPSAASSSCSALSASVGERRERQVAQEAVGRRGFDTGVSRAPEMDEEYQIQLALELSAREDPEAVQIEAVKQISLGSGPTLDTPAEVIAYRYWNYNALGYEDKVLDGFYDLYGVLAESTLVKMPSLVDLQGALVTDNISWEAVLVNRTGDADLVKLEQRALVMALESKSESLGFPSNDLVRKLAHLVANYMGGAVCEPGSMLKSWRNLSNYLRETIGNMVLPLGRLTFGLARHRALLFKVLADSVGIPCRLVKGQQFAGSDDGAVNIVKVNDGREFIVDLMADPGTLIPSDSASSANEFEDDFFVTHPLIGDTDKFHVAPSCSGASSSTNYSEIGSKLSISRNIGTLDTGGATLSDSEIKKNQNLSTSQHDCCTCGSNTSDEGLVQVTFSRPSYPFTLARSPSWTEGITSPSVHRMKVKDVSQYMIDAAKENPQLAQKLHDVLLESGVVAPPNLFTEVYTEQREKMLAEDMMTSEVLDETKKNVTGDKIQTIVNSDPNFLNGPFNRQLQRRVFPSRPQLDPLKPVDGLGLHQPSCFREASGDSCSSQSEVAAEETLQQFIKHMPVAAAAAAATAAVVASSMVVAAAKSNTEINMEVPVAAAVVATTAAVSRQYENLELGLPLASLSGSPHKSNISEKNEECYAANAQLGGDHGHDSGCEQEQVSSGMHPEMERNSDQSTGNESFKSDLTLDDVAELEIPWEDIILGERIGLGSFGEVYRADWHGTEVAVKRFLHQDILGDALEEFISEVRLMKRLRHPNVVLFMGAVTRVPNLSIVTEFLPRGSLFRLIHRSNSQLDERRRLRMALDVARGMNYLHNCNPVVVHRDLKSPNLLVDKNWVVKVCDFGLSRMKHSTFLSSRSTAGTAEWMAPEVLRNEPSDEKCDVFSFGVILWELCTLQQPWEGMNAMQVVGAVGFQQRRLDIPNDTDPVIADIIAKCWQTDPRARPSFADIMASLKLLQKPLSNVQVPKQRVRTSVKPEQGTS